MLPIQRVKLLPYTTSLFKIIGTRNLNILTIDLLIKYNIINMYIIYLYLENNFNYVQKN